MHYNSGGLSEICIIIMHKLYWTISKVGIDENLEAIVVVSEMVLGLRAIN